MNSRKCRLLSLWNTRTVGKMTSLCFRTHSGENFHTEISDAQVTQMHTHTHACPQRCRHKEQQVFHQSGPWNQWRCCLWCKRTLNSNVERWLHWGQATANYGSEFLSFLAYHAMYCTDTETDRQRDSRQNQASHIRAHEYLLSSYLSSEKHHAGVWIKQTHQRSENRQQNNIFNKQTKLLR